MKKYYIFVFLFIFLFQPTYAEGSYLQQILNTLVGRNPGQNNLINNNLQTYINKAGFGGRSMQTQTSTPAPGAETNPFIVPKDIVNPQKQVTNSSQQTSTTNLTDMSSMGATDALPTAPAPVQIPVNSISSIPTTPYYPQQTMNNPLSQMIYGNGNQNQLSSQLQAAMGPQANTVPPPSTDSLTQSLITAAQSPNDKTNPTDLEVLDRNPSLLQQVPNMWVNGWGVIGYFCNKTQYDPGTQQNGCTATGYDAFNCTKYIGLGASQKYISTLFGSTQKGFTQLVEVRLNGKCMVLPILDTNNNKSTFVQTNKSAYDISYATLKAFGYSDPNTVGVGKARMQVRALTNLAAGEEACGQKVDEAKRREILASIPKSQYCGQSFRPHSCVATNDGARCNPSGRVR